MKKLLVLALLCAATLSVQAQKAETDDQKAVLKDLLVKYDTNKDGKLDKDEKSKFSTEDKAKYDKAFPKKKKKTDTTTADAPAAGTTTK